MAIYERMSVGHATPSLERMRHLYVWPDRLVYLLQRD